MAPLAIEAAAQARAIVSQAMEDKRKVLEMELQQARYDASLAERRYAACDPDNRLIAAELERRWEGRGRAFRRRGDLPQRGQGRRRGRCVVDGTVTTASGISVTATGKNVAQTETLAVAIGSLGGSGTGSSARITSAANVTASVGTGASLTTGGAVLVQATGENEATSSSDAGSGGLLGIAAAVLESVVGGGVYASLDGSVTGASSLQVLASGDNRADSDALAISIGLAAGAGADAYAEVSDTADVEATVGSNAVINLPSSGTVEVDAEAYNRAWADADGGSGSLAVSIAVMFPEAKIAGGVLAEFDGEMVNDGSIADSLTVTASADNLADADTSITSISLLGAGSGAKAIATITSAADVIAGLGASAAVAARLVTVNASHVGAKNKADARVDSAGGALLASVSVVSSEASVGGSVIAKMDGEITSSTDVSITSSGEHIAIADTNVAGGGLVGYNSASSYAEVTDAASTEANAAAGSSISASGVVVFEAAGTSTANADSDAATGGFIAIGSTLPSAAVEADTRADIRADIAGADTIRVEAIGSNRAEAISNAVSGGLGAGNNANAYGTITSASQTIARIGSESDIDAPNAGLVVRSTADNEAIAKTQTTTGGLVAVSSATPQADSSGYTAAELLGNVQHGAGEAGAATITVLAQGTEAAVANVESVGGGLVSAQDSEAQARTGGVTEAQIAGSNRDIVATGDIVVTGLGQTDADATTKSSGGGGVNINEYEGSASASTAVNVSVGANSLVKSMTGLVKISAQHNVPQEELSDGSFDAGSVSSDTITFGASHGLDTNQTVVYNSNSQTEIGVVSSSDLEDGETYTVIATSPTTLQIGAAFQADAESIDLVNDTITFPVAHNLRDGDRVTFVSAGGDAVEKLVNGSTQVATGIQYDVVVIDDLTIKLAETNAPANEDISVAASLIDTDSVNVSHNFELNDAVTYIPLGDKFTFTADLVDVNVAEQSFDDGTFQAPVRDGNGDTVQVASNNNIFIGDNSFSENDKVVYTVDSPTLTASFTYEANGQLNDVPVDYVRNGNVVEVVRSDGGSWIDDGFLAGSDVTVTDSSGANGVYGVTAVTTDTLLLDGTDAVSLEANVVEGTFTFDRDETFSGIAFEFVRDGASVLVTRLDGGSWIDDGFDDAGADLVISGGTGADGSYTIDAVTDTAITISDGTDLVDDIEARRVVAEMTFEGRQLFAGIDVDYVRDGSAIEIVRQDGGSWLDDGFDAAGEDLVVSASPGASGTYTIDSATADTLTISDGADLLDDIQATVVISDMTFDGTSVSGLAVDILRDGATVQLVRGAGDWTADGFAIGEEVIISGGTGADGTYLVSGATATTLTLADDINAVDDIPATSFVAGFSFDADATGDTLTRTDGRTWIADGLTNGDSFDISGAGALDGTYTIVSGADSSTVLLTTSNGFVDTAVASATATRGDVTGDFSQYDRVTRDDGRSWEADGFTDGQAFELSNSGGRDGVWQILGGASTSTVVLTTATGFADGSETDVRADRGDGAGLGFASGDFLQPLDGDTITRNDGRTWADDGFQAGDVITVTGTADYNGVYEIGSINGDTIKLTEAGVLADGTVADVSMSRTVRLLTADMTFDGDAGGDSITRDDGFTWADAGLSNGDTFTIAGAGAGFDGSYTILSGAATGTVVLTSSNAFGDGSFSGVEAFEGDIDGAFDQPATGDRITRTDGRDWADDGFTNGSTVTITNAGAFNGTYTISDGDSSATITLSASGLFSADGTEAGTASRDPATTGDFNQSVVADRITRNDGKTWTEAGFADGATITLSTNPMQEFTIVSGAATSTILLDVSGALADGTQVATARVQEGAIGGLTNGETYRIAEITNDGTSIKLKRNDFLDDIDIDFVRFGNGTVQVVRNDGGDWLEDGFGTVAGETVRVIISDSNSSNGTFIISAATASTLTLASDATSTSTVDATILNGVQLDFIDNTGSNNDAIHRDDGRNWNADAFANGSSITLSGYGAGRDGTYTIVSGAGSTTIVVNSTGLTAGTNIGGGTVTLNGTFTADFDQPVLALDPSVADDETLHTLQPYEDQALPGLVEGRTYYVVSPDSGNSFKLAATPNGVALPLNTGGFTSGPHRFVVQGIDFSDTGSGEKQVVLNLTNGSGTQYFDLQGAGNFIGAPSGDGVVTASASGGGGGFIDVQKADAATSVTVSGTMTVGTGAVIEGNTVVVGSDIRGSTKAISSNTGGGFVSVGDANGKADIDVDSTLTVAEDAVLRATGIAEDSYEYEPGVFAEEGDVIVKGNVVAAGDSFASTNSGGLGAGVDSRARTRIGFDNAVDIDGALEAAGTLSVLGVTDVTGDVNAKATAAGLGADSDANDTDDQGVRIGVNNGFDADTIVTLLDNAALAGTAVIVSSTNRIDARADARSRATALGADSDARGDIYVGGSAQTVLREGSSIIGDETVLLKAMYDDIDLLADPFAKTSGVGGDTDSRANIGVNTESKVIGEDESVIKTARLDVQSLIDVIRFDRDPTRDGAAFDSGNTSQGGYATFQREIFWESTVKMLGEPNPLLIVDDTGKILQLRNIEFLGGNAGKEVGQTLTGEIELADIVYDTTGSAEFLATGGQSFDGLSTPTDQIWGNAGLFEIQRSWDSVYIENASALDLLVNRIDTLLDGSDVLEDDDPADIEIKVTSVPGPVDNPADDISLDTVANNGQGEDDGVTFEFNVLNNWVRPLVDILNVIDDDPTGSDIYLNGWIENPIGITTVRNERGSILSDADKELIRTSEIDLDATGSIGFVGDTDTFVDAHGYGDEAMVSATNDRTPIAIELVRWRDASEGIAEGETAADLDPGELDLTPSIPAGKLFEPDIEADAGGDVVLDLAYIDLADAVLGGDLSQDAEIRHIRAGDDVSLVINDMQEANDEGDVPGLTVYDRGSSPELVLATDHFRPNKGGPAYDGILRATNQERTAASVTAIDSTWIFEDVRAGDDIDIGHITTTSGYFGDEPRQYDTTSIGGSQYGAAISSAAPLTTVNFEIVTDVAWSGGTVDNAEQTEQIFLTTNGYILAEERTGDMLVGHINSTGADVTLDSGVLILDADGAPGVDVSGVNITLNSGVVTQGTGGLHGGIGGESDFLEIDVDTAGGGTGKLDAFDTAASSSHGGIFIDELDGDLRIGIVETVENVALRTVDGSVIDADDETDADVIGDSIDIDANGAGATIGTVSNDLDIDSRNGLDQAAFADADLDDEGDVIDDVALEASNGIFLTETDGALRLVLAHALAGNIRLTVRESSETDGDTLTGPDGEHLYVEDSGTARFAESNKRDPGRQTDGVREIANGTIFAEAGSVTLYVGDNIAFDANADILAAGGITIFGDAAQIDGSTALPGGDPDEGHGSTMILRGRIIANATVVPGNDGYSPGENGSLLAPGSGDPAMGTATPSYGAPAAMTLIYGNDDVDTIQFGDPSGDTGGTSQNDDGFIFLGSMTRAYGSQDDTDSTGDDGQDRMIVYYLQDTATVTSPAQLDLLEALGRENALHTLTLDGQADTDTYEVHTLGSQGDARNYIINVLDTGDEDDGVDTLDIFGRDSEIDPLAPDAVDDIFVMRAAESLPGETADRPGYVAMLHGTLDPYADVIPANEDSAEVQRITYDTGLNGRLTVEGQGGNDAFFSDDVTVIATYDGGTGNDTFQIGQIFGANRNVEDGNLLAEDEFPALVPTTRGWLSRGSSAPVLAQGGSGNDTFRVYSNQAELRLEGDDDNDLFIVRAFAIAATTDFDWNNDGTIDVLDLDVGRALLTHLYDVVEGANFDYEGLDGDGLPLGDDVKSADAMATLDQSMLESLGVSVADGAAAAAYVTALAGGLHTGDDDIDGAPIYAFDTNGDGGINFLDIFLTQEDTTDDVIVLDDEGVASPQIGLGFSVAQAPDIRAGGGQDEVRYNINAPVSVEGGTGFDKLVILGTEFADDIAITEDGVFGAGLNVRYSTVEVVEVDGLEGDDKFYVRSTAFGVAYRVIGGLGSDIINVAGDVQEDIITRELEGVSGAADHLVQSDGDIFYDGLVADGLDYNVTTDGQGLVVIDEGDDGFTAVREGETGGSSVDSYSVRLARKLTGSEVVYVTVSAARSPQDERDEAFANPAGLDGGPGDTIWVSTANPAGATTGNAGIYGVDYLENGTEAYDVFLRDFTLDGDDLAVANRAVVLRFDASNWDLAQDVHLWAVDDARAEGDRVVVVQHSVISTTSADYDAVDVRNVEVELRDNDTPGVLVIEADPDSVTVDGDGNVDGYVEDGRTLTIEGDATTGFGDIVLVKLAKEVESGQVVIKVNLGDLTGNPDLKALTDQAVTLENVAGSSRFDAATGTIIFDNTAARNWDKAVAIRIVPVDDDIREDPQTGVLSFGQNLGSFGQNDLYGDTGLTVGIGDPEGDLPDNIRLTLSGGGWVAGGVEVGEMLTITGIAGLTSGEVIGFEDAGLTAVLSETDAGGTLAGTYSAAEAVRDAPEGPLGTDDTFVFPNLRSGTGLLDIEVIDDETPGAVVLESGRDTVLVPATATGGIFDFTATTVTALEDGFDWLAEGFDVGDLIELSGTGGNDGTYEIGSLSGAVLTLEAAPADAGTLTSFASTGSGLYARILSEDSGTQSDTYKLRLTQEPSDDVTVSVITDGLADVTAIDRNGDGDFDDAGETIGADDYVTIGGLRAQQLFTGTILFDSEGGRTSLVRGADSDFGSFLNEGWAAGDLIEIANTLDPALDGITFEIFSVADDKIVLVQDPVAGAAATVENVLLSKLVERDIWFGDVTFETDESGAIRMVRTEAFVDTTGLDVNDPDVLDSLGIPGDPNFDPNWEVQGFLGEGFVEGMRVRIFNTALDADPSDYVDAKIAIIRGFNATKDHTIQFTFENNEDFDASWLDLDSGSAVSIELNRIAVQAVFAPNPEDPMAPVPENLWHQFQTVELTADPFYDVPTTREGVKIFPVKPHRLSDLRGPLAVEGGPSGADRSLSNGVKLPGELDDFLIAIGTQAPESQQIDVLNIFNDGSWADTSGVLTETTLSGFGMGPDLVFPFVQGPLFGEGAEDQGPVTLTYPGGISFGKVNFGSSGVSNDAQVSTIEVVNLMLGVGNDYLEVEGTLNPAPFVQAQNAFEAIEGWSDPDYEFLIGDVDDDGLPAAGLNEDLQGKLVITREGFDWKAQGFLVGQDVFFVDGEGSETLLGRIIAIEDAIEYFDINGNPLIDPETGEPYRDPNDNSLLVLDTEALPAGIAFLGDVKLIAKDQQVYEVLSASVTLTNGGAAIRWNSQVQPGDRAASNWAEAGFLEGHLLQVGIGADRQEFRIVEIVSDLSEGDTIIVAAFRDAADFASDGSDNPWAGEDGDSFVLEEAFWVQSDHGGLTVLHGGGNLYVNTQGTFDFSTDDGNQLTRTDGRAWAEAGFETGQIIQLEGETHTREILGIQDAAQAEYFDLGNGELPTFETWGEGSVLLLSDPLGTSDGAVVLTAFTGQEMLVNVAEALETSEVLDVRIEVLERGETIETYVTLIGANEGDTWSDLGYQVGGVLFIEGRAGGFQIAAIDGAELQLLNAALGDCADADGTATLRITTYDIARSALQRVGGDHFVVTGGAGPDSPLVIYGDTSQDGVWYAGEPNSRLGLEFGEKPFNPFPDLPDQENEDDEWVFALANPFDLHGNDIIDASALFADEADGGVFRSVGITAYGGMGNDLIIGSQTGDHLAGGSGDDIIIGQRGTDHIYGDSGFNVNILTRGLTVTTVNLSPLPSVDPGAPRGDSSIDPSAGSQVADLLGKRIADRTVQAAQFAAFGAVPGAGDDLIEGNGSGTPDGTPDIIFGDHGEVVQFVIDPNLPDPVGRLYLGEIVPDGIPQKIQTTFLGTVLEINSVEPQTGGDDVVFGSEIDDILIGGAGNDMLDGGEGDDLIFGDNVNLNRRGGTEGGIITSLRFQTLAGTMMYSRSDRALSEGYDGSAQGPGSGVLMVSLDSEGNPIARDYRDPNGPGWWTEYEIDYAEYHSFDVQEGTTGAGSFGNDYLAGGEGHDQIFGQLGNDVIQGDGSIRGAVATKGDGTSIGAESDNPLFGGLILPERYVSAARELPETTDPVGALKIVAATEGDPSKDGNDYIEGGGGCDTVFGGLGQDDIVGGSSSFFSLVHPDLRPDGEDMLFGGSGARTDRNDERAADDGTLGFESGLNTDEEDPDLGEDTVIGAGRNARDADVILGDNGDIIRIVGINGIDVLDTDGDGTNDIDIGSYGPDGAIYATADEALYGTKYLTRSTLSVTGGGVAFMTGGLYLAYNYDVNLDGFSGLTGTTANENVRDTGYNDEGGERIVVRGATLLDYSAGGPDYAGSDGVSGNLGKFDLDTDITLDKNLAVPEGGDLWRSTFGFWSLVDIGGGDEIHGGTGDDIAYGGGGNDIIFGDADHDDIVGGWGNDWISGGTGNDGVIGDDGRIFTSRNTGLSDDGQVSLKGNTRSFGNYGTEFAEELFGVWSLLNADPDSRTSQGIVLNEEAYTPGQVQRALLNRAGELVKSVDISPFDIIDSSIERVTSADPTSHDPDFADDVIFGGLGDDFLHGGSGDDAIGGQEALRDSYMVWFSGDLPQNSAFLEDDELNPDNPGTDEMVLVRTDFTRPWNPGNILLFGTGEDHWNEPTPVQQRTGEFYLYDEYDPRRVILFNEDGTLWKGSDDPSGYRQYFLNAYDNEGLSLSGITEFEPNGDPVLGSERVVQSDGDDRIFGDMGNDWIVGGTGRDHIYGGFGNDLMNADDVQGGPGTSYDDGTFGAADDPDGDGGDMGLNDTPETHYTWEDRVFGGAGLDILIGNTGGDRLIDHLGEFNSYIVPFAPFGIATVSRQVPPQLWDFLTAQAASDGVDMTRAADQGALTADQDSRYSAVIQQQGNPHGEIGLVTQRDHGFWQDQSGPPTDPQAGNIPGGARDILRTADFNDRSGDGFAVDRGKFTAEAGALEIASETPDSVASAVFLLDDYKPSYFEIVTDVQVDKPTAGWKANAFAVFDYYSDNDFKFAGIDISTNKIVMGYYDETGIHYVRQSNKPVQIKPDQTYRVTVAVNGNNVTVAVAGVNYFDHDYAPRYDVYGDPIPMARGMVGVAMVGSKGRIDNFKVQILPPEWTLEETDDFLPPVAELPRVIQSSEWAEASGTLVGTAMGPAPAVQTVDLGVPLMTNSILEMEVDIETEGMAGFVFDRYDAFDYKFVALDTANDRVVVGHATPEDGQVIDAAYAVSLDGSAVRLKVSIQGAGLDILVNGSEIASHGFNAGLVDGGFGLAVIEGEASFSEFRLATNDQQFEAALKLAAESVAALDGDAYIAADPVDPGDVQRIYAAALEDWVEAGFVTEAEADALADVQVVVTDLEGATLARVLDENTIAIDLTAAGAGWNLEADPEDDTAYDSGLVSGGVDLLTVLRHEIGHLLGYEHDDLAIMSAELSASTRIAVDAEDAPPAEDSGTATVDPAPEDSTDPVVTDGKGNGRKSAALVYDPETGTLVDGAEADQLFASRNTGGAVLAGGAVALAGTRLASAKAQPAKPKPLAKAATAKARGLRRWFSRSA
ncbi:hypothetical protein [Mangrovicoccus ximenensis]|uniref:hypothetical protein n=1 Tax=Mangrovicoccus ximenensis TaxID=1911570 RepID=UPI00191C5B03|nr:hypothetical protein [Mangrovicoccus ximenensis]